MAYKSPYDDVSFTQGPKKKKKVVTQTKSPYAGLNIGVKATPTNTGSNTNTTIKSNPLNVAALSEGYKGFGVGQGNAAFEKAAAESLQKTINTKSGTNYTPYQVAGAIRAGDTNIPGLASGNLIVPQQTQVQSQQGQFDVNTKKYIDEYLAKAIGTIPKVDPYQGQYGERIESLLGRVESPAPFNFNPNDPALQQLQNEAIQRSRVDSSRRGRTFDTFADIQAQEAAQGLIPSFYNSQLGQYNTDRNYNTQALNTMRNVDQTGYNRYIDTYNMGQDRASTERDIYGNALDYGTSRGQTDYNRAYDQRQEQRLTEDRATQQEQTIQKQEVAEFGTPLSPQMREYRQSFLDIPQDVKAKLIQLGNQPGGFATAINQMQPNDPMLPMLQAMRANKVLSDPELLAKYGAEYGMQTGAIGAMGTEAEQLQAKQLQTETINKLEVIKMKKQNSKYASEISKIQEEVKKIGEEAKRIVAQTGLYDKQKAEKEIDISIKRLELADMPEKLKKDMRILLAREKQILNSAYSSLKSGQLSASRTKTEEELRQGKKDIQKATVSKLAKEINKDDSRLLSNLHSKYLESGQNLNEWLMSPRLDTNGEPIKDVSGRAIPWGERLTDKQLSDFKALALKVEKED